MNTLEICKQLEAQGLPFPLQQCGACSSVIYKKGEWRQCPDCGALTTAFGGLFMHAGVASDEWKDECKQAQTVIAKLQICAHCDCKGFWPAADAGSVFTVFCSHCYTGVKAQAEHAATRRTELDDSMTGLIERMKRDGKWQAAGDE